VAAFAEHPASGTSTGSNRATCTSTTDARFAKAVAAIPVMVARTSREGPTLALDTVGSSESDNRPGSASPENLDVTGTWQVDEDLDPGVVRAGAAAAARRRELDISQRSLAADGIINAGALIAFEKGRSWPREKTRDKLEEILRWPPGTIARIRDGGTTPATTRGEDATEILSAEDQIPLIAQAVIAAADSCSRAVAALPSAEDPGFTRAVEPILADLRRVEAVAIRATQIGKVSLPLIRALSTVRRHYEDLMFMSAKAPQATLGQRLYAARRRANLSVSETAQAAGIAEDAITRAEAEDALPAPTAAALESLIEQISWR
jgi:transcriptional regulator with XRE-family HTH domain